MRTRFFGKALLMATASFMLAACAGNAPCPATDVQPVNGTQALLKDTTIDAGQTAAQNATTPATNPEAGPAATQPQATPSDAGQTAAFDSQALDSYRLNTPDNIPVRDDGSFDDGVIMLTDDQMDFSDPYIPQAPTSNVSASSSRSGARGNPASIPC